MFISLSKQKKDRQTGVTDRHEAHSPDSPQWEPARSPAVVNTDRPIRETVGVMVSGPMYFSSRPGNPHRPITTSTRLDMMMAP